MKKKLTKVLATMLALVIGVSTTDISVFASGSDRAEPFQTEEVYTAENSVSAGDVANEEDVDNWDGVTTESVYEGAGYKVTFSLTGHWDGGYNANIKLENTGAGVIENWYLGYEAGNEIANIWNAQVHSHENGKYVIKNAGWNQDIAVGGSVQFGFSGNEDFLGFPKEYTLLGESEETNAEDYTVEYHLDSDWGSGFSGTITITNNTDWVLEDWVIEFDFAREISSIWDATMEACENGHYVIRNVGYNANIAAGQSVCFGFVGNGGNEADVPENISLYAYKPYNGASMELDTDGDGIVDGDETLWGLDYEKADSDGDGLTDFEELNIILTDPLLVDTDEDGITDDLEDVDGDGINNRMEIAYGTNPLSADTDGDNLTDYEEIYTYYSDALKPDSDGDGLSDYDDVCLGFSPLLPDSDNDGILDANEKIEQIVEMPIEEGGRGVTKVSVSMKVAGNAQTNVGIVNTYGMDAFSSNVAGLVGVPVEINTKMQFDTAEITFYYDETALGSVKEENLAVLWYDEANNWYRILDKESVVDTVNNKVSYVTTHFSTYMLVDSLAWHEAWRANIDYRNSVEGDEKQYFDIVFVVDGSSSMSGNSISTARTALRNFVDAMQNEDEAAIVRFEDSATTFCEFTNDSAALKNGINRLYARGTTNVNNGLLKALELFANRDNERQKVIVLICDGDVNYVQSTIDSCVEQNIQIYAVNVASSPAHESLEKMANLTGGQYYYGTNASSLKDMLSFIQGDTLDRIDPTDTDGDGLYDIYETAGIKLFNGKVVYTDPNKVDTDGDGLSDFEETGLIYNVDDRYIGLLISKSIKHFLLRSDPTNADTDGDGIGDAKDPHPWDMEAVWVAELPNKYSGVEYLKVEETADSFKHGGNQGWWQEEANSEESRNFGDFATDKAYRIWKTGCGLIAVTDVEIYLMQQNEGYKPSISELPSDPDTGIIQKEDYMAYANFNADLIYDYGGGILHYCTGLPPRNMEVGLEAFLRRNKHEQKSVTWSPYSLYGKEDEKKLVLNEIQKMLNNDLPVVFSYYSPDKDKPLRLYSTLEHAKLADKDADQNSRTPISHYMTVIGLYKYMDEDSTDYEYILKIVSWGKIFYVRYDDYSDNLSYVSNILRIQ